MILVFLPAILIEASYSFIFSFSLNKLIFQTFRPTSYKVDYCQNWNDIEKVSMAPARMICTNQEIFQIFLIKQNEVDFFFFVK